MKTSLSVEINSSKFCLNIIQFNCFFFFFLQFFNKRYLFFVLYKNKISLLYESILKTKFYDSISGTILMNCLSEYKNEILKLT